jgi:hypothetical protein
MKFPCNVYYPRENGEPKVLVAKDQDELDGLLRIGWMPSEEDQAGILKHLEESHLDGLNQ